MIEEKYGKGTRQPYRNSLGWKQEEEQIIRVQYKAFGTDWKAISGYLQDRSPNSVKNKMNCHEKKFVNRINFLLKHEKKSIQMSSVNKFLFLTAPDNETRFTQIQKYKYESLRNQIIDKCFSPLQSYTKEQAHEVYQSLKQFNINFRHTNARKILTMSKNKSIPICSKAASKSKRRGKHDQGVKTQEIDQASLNNQKAQIYNQKLCKIEAQNLFNYEVGKAQNCFLLQDLKCQKYLIYTPIDKNIKIQQKIVKQEHCPGIIYY